VTQSNSRSYSGTSYCAAYYFQRLLLYDGDSDEDYYFLTTAAATTAESVHASDSWQQNVLSSITTNLLRQLCAIEHHPSIRPL
jgi:hypothetical protein